MLMLMLFILINFKYVQLLNLLKRRRKKIWASKDIKPKEEQNTQVREVYPFSLDNFNVIIEPFLRPHYITNKVPISLAKKIRINAHLQKQNNKTAASEINYKCFFSEAVIKFFTEIIFFNCL